MLHRSLHPSGMRLVRVEALLFVELITLFFNNDGLKLEVLSLSGRLFHKYGNLSKKVPLNNSVLTLLIFNLLLEYDLNLLSEQNSKYLPTEYL